MVEILKNLILCAQMKQDADLFIELARKELARMEVVPEKDVNGKHDDAVVTSSVDGIGS